MRVQFDDKWCDEARDAVLYPYKENKLNILIAKLGKRYPRKECEQYDLIASATTGTDHIDNGTVPLICLQGETEFLRDVHATAEMTIGLMLALTRKIPAAFKEVCAGHWDREKFQGTELHGKTLGIVGFGRVGGQVWKLCSNFGMNCSVALKTEGLPHTLKQSDIITVHVPLNDETRGMFGKEQFAMMKPTSLFINTSRGAIVDEEALVWSLENKIIAGAALDVVQNEPCVNPRLLDYAKNHNNLILSPHIAGNTVESRKKCQLFIAKRIADFIEQNMV